MSAASLWFLAFIAAYWAFGLFWGIVGARHARTALDYFLAGRRLPAFSVVLLVPVAAFSGYALLGMPDLILSHGLPSGFFAVGAVMVALSGVLFLKRQWMLGRRFGFVSAGEMFAAYYQSDVLRLFVLAIGLIFAIPFVALQLAASGTIVAVLTGGAIDPILAQWALSIAVFLYVVLGGMRAVAYVGTLQALLMAAGAITTGVVALALTGGFGGLNEALAAVGQAEVAALGLGGSEAFHPLMEVSGVIQFTHGLGSMDPGGTLWTAAMVLSFGFALMGIQAGPAFTMLGFSARDARPFTFQQVWITAGFMGAVLLVFGMAQGLGGLVLGAEPALTAQAVGTALADESGVPLVLRYVVVLAERAPWFVGLIGVSLLAAIHGMVALFVGTSATMLARDGYTHFIAPKASDQRQVMFGRLFVFAVMLAALIMATFLPLSAVQLGGLALAFGAQLLPALVGLCWFRWLTRPGVLVGLGFGLAGVILTETFGLTLASFAGLELPWGRWPWTLHSAGWGLLINVALCVLVSLVTMHREPDKAHRHGYHDFLRRAAGLPRRRRSLRGVAWGLMLAWVFLAMGPGIVMGNSAFGAPEAGLAAWVLSVPSLWAWQMLSWTAGVLILWFLATKMEMATPPHAAVEPLAQDARVEGPSAGRGPKSLLDPQVGLQVFWALILGFAVLTGVHWAFG